MNKNREDACARAEREPSEQRIARLHAACGCAKDEYDKPQSDQPARAAAIGDDLQIISMRLRHSDRAVAFGIDRKRRSVSPKPDSQNRVRSNHRQSIFPYPPATRSEALSFFLCSCPLPIRDPIDN